MTQQLDLVEIVKASAELNSHAAFHLYVCYCAHRDDVTGVSKPSNITINTETGISYDFISKLKATLIEKRWIEHLGGRRVRPLKGFSILKNRDENSFSGEEGSTEPKYPPVKNCDESGFRVHDSFSEGTAEGENCHEHGFSILKNRDENSFCKNCDENSFPPTPPYKDQSIARENKSKLASLPPKNLKPEEFRERYGRDWGEICDEAFIVSMRGHPDFAGLRTHREVYREMVGKAKKRLTCGRYVAWLRKELEFGAETEHEDESNRRETERNQGSNRGSAGADGTLPGRGEDHRFRPAKVLGSGF